MVLYLSIIFASGLICSFCNCLFAQDYLGATALEIINITWLAVLISFLIDALCAFMIRQIPERKINEKSRFFKVRKWEKKLFSFLKVKKWKDNIPELGGLLKYFDKSFVQEKAESKYMMKFIKETCYAEIMHVISLFLAPIVLIVLPRNFLLTIVLPVMIVNILLQIPPILVQRLNRPKLEFAYKRLKRTEEMAENKE
ncbi:MAG: hypothetical protein EOM55_04235 [Clostridia bacterium]|nr:hypothetical protein [Clostridia bacterium]